MPEFVVLVGVWLVWFGSLEGVFLDDLLRLLGLFVGALFLLFSHYDI